LCSTFFPMILFQQCCALDAAIRAEIRRGCHLIVNFFEAS
jgi:hypothetical protein